MFAKFLKETKGGFTSLFAVIILPLILPSLAAVQTTSYAGFSVRHHQSETAALVFIAKQGEILDADKKSIADAFMDANMALTEAVKISPVDNQGDGSDSSEPVTQSLLSVYSPKNLVGKSLATISFDKFEPLQEVETETFRYPMEIVVSLDTSQSAAQYVPGIHDGIVEGIEEIFGKEDLSSDTRISLMSYNSTVSFPAKYARKLAKPESRKLYVGTTEAERIKRDRRFQIMKDNGLEDDDLLAPGAPGVDVDQICFLRKSIVPGSSINDPQVGPDGATDSELEEYVKHIDDSIDNLQTDGFELATFDGRMFPYNRTPAGMAFVNKNTALPTSDLQALGFVAQVNLSLCHYQGCPGRDDLFKFIFFPKEAQAKIPNTIRYYNPTASGRVQADDLRVWITRIVTNKIVSSTDEIISANGNETSLLPVLAGSNSKSELINHMKYYNFRPDPQPLPLQMMTALDEGIMWAFRLLSPNYSKIWDVSNDFPSEYHTKTIKRLIVYAGSSSWGYARGSTSGSPRGKYNLKLISLLCKQLRNNGVEIYTMGETGMGTYIENDAELDGLLKADCADYPNHPERYANYKTSDDATVAFFNAFKRKYHVRLKKI
jgi:hypothetical protein